jgi:hypothetical protein
MDFKQRLTCSIKEASAATGLGLTKIGEAVRDGRIKSKLVDGRRILDVPSVINLVSMDQAPSYTPSRRGFTAQRSGRKSLTAA